MINATIQPSMNELYNFIDKVGSYPISVDKLLNLARRYGKPRVANFYKAFPEQVFYDREDLTGRTEQVEVLRFEHDDMPADDFQVPEED